MGAVVDPFIYSGADSAYKIAIQGPELGIAHLSKLSIEELKTIAQLFNVMAGKYRAYMGHMRVVAAILGGVSVVAFSVGIIEVIADAEELVIGGFFLYSVAFGIVSAALATGGATGNQMRFYDTWKNRTLEILTLKIDAQ